MTSSAGCLPRCPRHQHILLQHFGLVRRLFAGCVSIQVPYHVLDFLLQLPEPPLLRPLKNLVLEKLRHTVDFGSFILAAGINSDFHCGVIGGHVALTGHTQSVREGGDLVFRRIKHARMINVLRRRRIVTLEPLVPRGHRHKIPFHGLALSTSLQRSRGMARRCCHCAACCGEVSL